MSLSSKDNTKEIDALHQKMSLYEVQVGIGIFFLLISIALLFTSMAFIFLTFGIVCWLIYSAIKLKELNLVAKSTVVKSRLSQLIPGSIFEPKKGFDADFVYDTYIIRRESTFHSEDHLEGEILGRHFQSADVVTKRIVSTGKSVTVIPIFVGRLYIVDFPKSFPGDVYVVNNREIFFPGGSSYKRIDLESIEFNQTFDVFASDPQHAFYLLTPRFLERISAFKKRYDKVRFAFRNQQMMIAIDSKVNTFDLTFMSRIDEAYLDQIKDEIRTIEEIIQEIN